MNQEQINPFHQVFKTTIQRHYSRDNVYPNTRKVKVGSYVEVSIDNLEGFVEGCDDGGLVACGVVKNIVYREDNRTIIPQVDYIEVAVDMKKRPDGILYLAEQYTEYFDVSDMTHLFVY